MNWNVLQYLNSDKYCILRICVIVACMFNNREHFFLFRSPPPQKKPKENLLALRKFYSITQNNSNKKFFTHYLWHPVNVIHTRSFNGFLCLIRLRHRQKFRTAMSTIIFPTNLLNSHIPRFFEMKYLYLPRKVPS